MSEIHFLGLRTLRLAIWNTHCLIVSICLGKFFNFCLISFWTIFLSFPFLLPSALTSFLENFLRDRRRQSLCTTDEGFFFFIAFFFAILSHSLQVSNLRTVECKILLRTSSSCNNILCSWGTAPESLSPRDALQSFCCCCVFLCCSACELWNHSIFFAVHSNFDDILQSRLLSSESSKIWRITKKIVQSSQYVHNMI